MSILQFKIKTLSSEGNMTLCMRPAETTKAKIDPNGFKYQNRKLSWLLCLKKQKKKTKQNLKIFQETERNPQPYFIKNQIEFIK